MARKSSLSKDTGTVVEKFINTSYDTVKVVHDNIDAVVEVSTNMESILAIDPNLVAQQASDAASSAGAASTSETNAASSESVSATNANTATAQANIATTKANEASSSASAASSSETAALSSKNSSTASQSAASTSESNAASSESNAASSESASSTSETNAASSATAALLSKNNAAADAVQTNLDVTQTTLDVAQTTSDRNQTGLDETQTGLDVLQTVADAAQTVSDAVATAADRVQTGLDRVQTGSDSAQTISDAADTAADRVQTTSDASATAADVVSTNADVVSTNADVAAMADKLDKSGGAMTGPLTTSSTIAGRDVAADGTKLDTVELAADVTDTGNVTAAGAVMDSELASIADVKSLNQSVVSGATPNFGIANMTIDDTNLDIVDTTNLQSFVEGVDHALFKARGTGVTSSYVSTIVVGGTTFSQPAVNGEISGESGYFDIHYAGSTNVTISNLSAPSTYVYIDTAGTLQQQTTTPTRMEWCGRMYTMRIAVDASAIVGFEYLNNPIGHYANSIRDLYTYLLAQGVPFKKDQTITGRAGDLGFDVSAGTLMEFGGTGDIHNANIKSFDSVSNAEFYLFERTSLNSTAVTALPKFWDNNGTITALGSTTVVGHRLYRFSNGNLCLQYGQGNYANINLAKSGAVLESYVLNPVLENATFFGWWFIESTATNTGGTTLTSFVEYTLGVQGGSSSGLSGAVLKGNNLSDLLDASASRSNLGVDAAGTSVAMAIALGG